MSTSEMTHDEALAHFGVKGMHWGVRRNRDESSSGGGSKTPAKVKPYKPTTNDIIAARQKLRHLQNKSFLIEDRFDAAKTQAGKDAAKKEWADLEKDWASTAAVARKKTGGEKVATALAVTSIALFAVGTAAAKAGRR